MYDRETRNIYMRNYTKMNKEIISHNMRIYARRYREKNKKKAIGVLTLSIEYRQITLYFD